MKIDIPTLRYAVGSIVWVGNTKPQRKPICGSGLRVEVQITHVFPGPDTLLYNNGAYNLLYRFENLIIYPHFLNDVQMIRIKIVFMLTFCSPYAIIFCVSFFVDIEFCIHTGFSRLIKQNDEAYVCTSSPKGGCFLTTRWIKYFKQKKYSTL